MAKDTRGVGRSDPEGCTKHTGSVITLRFVDTSWRWLSPAAPHGGGYAADHDASLPGELELSLGRALAWPARESESMW